MKNGRRVALLVLALPLAFAAVYAGCTHLRSPEAVAKEDSYAVWIALLKGFSGDVAYVGSDETHAYFQVGTIFADYYKLPRCAARLPETFLVGHGTPYLVKLHVEGGAINVVSECTNNQNYALGQLDRK